MLDFSTHYKFYKRNQTTQVYFDKDSMKHIFTRRRQKDSVLMLYIILSPQTTKSQYSQANFNAQNVLCYVGLQTKRTRQITKLFLFKIFLADVLMERHRLFLSSYLDNISMKKYSIMCRALQYFLKMEGRGSIYF